MQETNTTVKTILLIAIALILLYDIRVIVVSLFPSFSFPRKAREVQVLSKKEPSVTIPLEAIKKKKTKFVFDRKKLRDPFQKGQAIAIELISAKVFPEPLLRLTAIFYSEKTPLAILEEKDITYTVKVGDMVSEKKVVAIKKNSIILDENGERTTLYLWEGGK